MRCVTKTRRCLTHAFPARTPLQEPQPARISSRRVSRMGRPGQSARRRLRSRTDAQRTRFRRAGAAILPDRFRVLCPDMPGRGDSEWLRDPNDYAFPTYLTTLTAMLAHAHADRVAWVGTSMGGLLGMVMAAQPETPVDPARRQRRRAGASSRRAGTHRRVRRPRPALRLVRRARSAYPRGVGAVRRAVPTRSGRRSQARRARVADGSWRLKYDPGIAVPFRAAAAQNSDIWPIWDAISCPTLLLRGAESDLLSRATAAAMRTRGPKPELIEFPASATRRCCSTRNRSRR